MKIKDILNNNKIVLSYEIFPPKKELLFEPVLEAINKLSNSKPDFISVTYGAGGSNNKETINIASYIQNNLNITTLAHLTCSSSTKDEIIDILNNLKTNNIENILALRGDILENSSLNKTMYRYAFELIKDIKLFGNFCIGAACYPEGHIESKSNIDDIENLKFKVDSGVDFLTTQMFFDNNILYNFLYKIREKNINVPVIAGIMPVTNSKQISKICKLSGTNLPIRFKTIVDKFGNNTNAMKQAGIAYATEQIIDLVANGIKGIHIYTMNKPDIAEGIKNNLSYIIGDNQ